MGYGTDELRDWLGAALAAETGVRRRVASVERRAADYHSSWQMEDVDVTFEGGEALALVVKDLSPGSVLAAARDVKPAFLVDPAREVEVYRRVLRRAGLNTPRLYGAIVDPAAARHLLVLERIHARPLWQVGSFAAWEATAAWLARLHGRCTPRAVALAEPARLLRYDAAYFAQWIGRAVRNVEARDTTGGDDAAVWSLKRLALSYDRVVRELSALPVAFIHGEFQASNVLIADDGAGNSVVRPVDWEMAALGPALMDVADLSGGWPEPQRLALAAAYARAAGGADAAALARPLDLCRLHRAVQWLGWADPSWRPPAEHAQDWLGEALAVAGRLGL